MAPKISQWHITSQGGIARGLWEKVNRELNVISHPVTRHSRKEDLEN